MPSAVPPVSPRRRLPGVDLARAAAIVGMVMVHVREAVPDGEVGLGEVLYALTRGRASVLFAVLASVGIALAASAAGRSSARLGLQLLGRSVVLVPLGLALQVLHDQVHVILHFYAVYLALAWLALRLPSRVVLLSAAGWAVLGPVLYLLARTTRPEWYGEAARLGDSPGLVLRDVLLTGAYPAVTWGVPVLFGVWIGRQDLGSPVVRVRMVAGGATVTAAAWLLSRGLEASTGTTSSPLTWWRLVTDDAHSEMPLWLVGATASAVTVLGACLWLAEALPRATAPLVAFGRVALTAYVLHLLLLALVPDLVIHPDVRLALLSVLAFTVVVTLAAVLWLRVFDYGPLEALARAPYRVLSGARRRGARPVPGRPVGRGRTDPSPPPPSHRDLRSSR